MEHIKIIKFLIVSFLFLLFPLGLNVAGEDKPITFQLSKDKNTYFYQCDVHCNVILFQSNGTYHISNVGHLGSLDIDWGNWTQEQNGKITLQSDPNYADIISGPLKIDIRDKVELGMLPDIKDIIVSFLKNYADEYFTTHSIEGIKIGVDSIIDVDYGIEYISRKELEQLINKIDEYIASDKKNYFYLTPTSYKSFSFLVWDNPLAIIGGDLSIEEITKRIDIEGNLPWDIYSYKEIDEKKVFAQIRRIKILSEIILVILPLLTVVTLFLKAYIKAKKRRESLSISKIVGHIVRIGIISLVAFRIHTVINFLFEMSSDFYFELMAISLLIYWILGSISYWLCYYITFGCTRIIRRGKLLKTNRVI